MHDYEFSVISLPNRIVIFRVTWNVDGANIAEFKIVARAMLPTESFYVRGSR